MGRPLSKKVEQWPCLFCGQTITQKADECKLSWPNTEVTGSVHVKCVDAATHLLMKPRSWSQKSEAAS